MKALSLTQPWATLVVIGAKRNETRSWGLSHHLPITIAIHAAKGLGLVGGLTAFRHLINSDPYRAPLLKWLGQERPYQIYDLPRGAIVAVADVVGCFPTSGAGYYRDPNRRVITRVTDQERAFGDYSPGRFVWLLDNIRALPEPIPAKGALGLWELDAVTLAAVEGQLEAAHV